MEENRKDSNRRNTARRAGKAVAVAALLLIALGFALTFFGAGASVFPGALGAATGILAYALDSRRHPRTLLTFAE